MICVRSDCTGCGMCTNICPEKAIEMKKDNHGFYYPVIDETKCTKCNLCKKKCPVNNIEKKESSIIKVYACWNKNKKIRNTSTSGGVFTAIAQKILEKNGVVVGVSWDEEFNAVHTIVKEKEKLNTLRGSKYVQCKTGQIYTDVRKFLTEGKTVLFSGTPCQNMALRAFLGRDFENLICIDLICHGVPSNDLFNRYLEEISEGKSIKNIVFRDKNPHWDYSNVKVEFTDSSKYEVETIEDPYFTLFNIGFSLRDSCHSCQYANLARVGDITLADFWGFVPKSRKMLDYNKGISLVLVNTQKGIKFFDSIKENLNLEESIIDKAMKGQKCLSESFNPPEDEVENFWRDYENGASVEDMSNKYVPNRFKKPKYLFLRRLKNRWIVRK